MNKLIFVDANYVRRGEQVVLSFKGPKGGQFYVSMTLEQAKELKARLP